MGRFILLLGTLICGSVSADNLKLIYSDGEVSLLRAGQWTVVDEGALVGEKDILRLEPGAKAVIQGREVKLYLGNQQAGQKLFALEKVLADWSATRSGQNALAARLDQLVGGKVKRDTANMGVRSMSEKSATPDGLDNPEKTADGLWSQAQSALDQGQDKRAEDLLNRILAAEPGIYTAKAAFSLANLHWKNGKPQEALTDLDRCVELKTQKEGIFLYAQLYLETQDWKALGILVEEKAGKGHRSGLAKDQKQALVYFQVLASLAQETNPQPFIDRIREIDPESDWAKLTVAGE